MKGLTTRQREIYSFIVKSIKTKGVQPSYPEMMRQFSITSPKGIADHIKALERKGYLRKEIHKHRGLILTKKMIPFESEKIPPGHFEHKLKTDKPMLHEYIPKPPSTKENVIYELSSIIADMSERFQNINNDEMGYARLSAITDFAIEFARLKNLAMTIPGLTKKDREGMVQFTKKIEEMARLHSKFMVYSSQLEKESIKLYADISEMTIPEIEKQIQETIKVIQCVRESAKKVKVMETTKKSTERMTTETERWLERWHKKS